MILLVGLTGGIATGKSMCAEVFRRNGIEVIDADAIAKEVARPGTSAYAKLRQEFTDEYFDDQGEVRRDKMASLVFHDPAKRAKLNEIIHPAVAKEIAWQVLIAILKLRGIAVLDIPLLFEKGVDRFIRPVVVVHCGEETQLSRLMRRDDLTEDEAISRIAAQAPLAEKINRATYLIDNNGSMDETALQVEDVIKQLRSDFNHRLIKTIAMTSAGVVTVVMAKYAIAWFWH